MHHPKIYKVTLKLKKNNTWYLLHSYQVKCILHLTPLELSAKTNKKYEHKFNLHELNKSEDTNSG